MAMANYEKYRWFLTTRGSLVVGGKNSEQNEALVKQFMGKKNTILHTMAPGSPFSVIMSDGPSKDELNEAAIFTACFSQQWKKGKRLVEVHVFSGRDVKKERGMKEGTFGVANAAKRISVPLKLVLAEQNGKLRAVPESAAGKSLAILTPGKMDKQKAAAMLKNMMDYSIAEIEQALPAGGFNIK